MISSKKYTPSVQNQYYGTMLIVLSLGCILALLGLFGLVRAIRGRLVSEHPHCRSCRFDLHGLELTKESRCPECGHVTPPDTRYVRAGLRKRRPILLLISLLVLLVGVGGVSWPKLSKLPAIKNIDWYASSPEWMLLWLESTGNTKALQELHDRLIPGEVSDEGLQTLVERAFAHQADTNTPWDERWGDVLLYAMLTHQLPSDKLGPYIEGLVLPVIYQHEEMGMNDTVFYTELTLHGKVRGASSIAWLDNAARAGVFNPGNLKFRAQGSSKVSSQSGTELSAITSIRPGGTWSPSSAVLTKLSAYMDLEPEHTTLKARYQCTVNIIYNDRVLHEWTVDLSKETRRVRGVVQYAEPVRDLVIAKDLVSRLEATGFLIPDSVEKALSIPELGSYKMLVPGVQGRGQTEIALVGKLSLRDQTGEEVTIGSLSGVPVGSAENAQVIQSLPIGWAFWIQPGGSDYTIDDFWADRGFWGRVWRHRRVDLIYRPDPARLSTLPQVHAYLDQPVIFHDIPIGLIQPNFHEETQSWGWRSQSDVHMQKIPGKLLGE